MGDVLNTDPTFYPPPNTHSHCIQHRSLSPPKRSQCGMVSAQIPASPSTSTGTKLHDHINRLPPHGLDMAHPKGSEQLVSLSAWLALLSRGSQVTCRSVRKIFPTQRSHLPHHSVAFPGSASPRHLSQMELSLAFFSNLLTWISSAFLLEYQLQEGRDLS